MSLSNKDLGLYLKKLRENLGLTTRQVYDLSGVSNGYLSLVEHGKRKASAIVLKKLSPIYKVDYLELYEKAGYIDLIEDEKNELLKKIGAIPLSSNPNIVKIPIIGSVKAGYDYLVAENRIGEIETSLVGNSSEYFALEVKGDSMSPIFIEGDIVIIKKQNDCENNEIAIIIVNGEEGTIKKVRKTEQGIILQPLNPAYAPMIFTNEEIKSIPITIVGIVKELKRKF